MQQVTPPIVVLTPNGIERQGEAYAKNQRLQNEGALALQKSKEQYTLPSTLLALLLEGWKGYQQQQSVNRLLQRDQLGMDWYKKAVFNALYGKDFVNTGKNAWDTGKSFTQGTSQDSIGAPSSPVASNIFSNLLGTNQSSSLAPSLVSQVSDLASLMQTIQGAQSSSLAPTLLNMLFGGM